jgi:prepilin-type N-terminal cleavage/methylation domain-containing protein
VLRRRASTDTARARFVRGERGFTLMEVLVSSLLMVIAGSAIFTWLEQSTHVSTGEIERAVSVSEQAAAFERMIGEIRQAYQVNCPSGGCTNGSEGKGAESNYLDFDVRATFSGQKDKRVAYACNVEEPGTTWYECVRYQAPASDTPAKDAVPLSSTCTTECTTSVVIKRIVLKPVFTKLMTAKSLAGTERWVSGKASVYSPNAGALNSKLSNYASDLVLAQRFRMQQLQFGQ